MVNGEQLREVATEIDTIQAEFATSAGAAELVMATAVASDDDLAFAYDQLIGRTTTATYAATSCPVSAPLPCAASPP